MALKPPNVSDETWLGAAIGVGGFLCSLVGVAAIIWHDPMVLLAIAAGSGWTLSIILYALYKAQRRRLAEVDTDLAEARRQAGEWSTTSNNIALAARGVLDLAGVAPAAPRRRTRARTVTTSLGGDAE